MTVRPVEFGESLLGSASGGCCASAPVATQRQMTAMAMRML
jgi:hypothetical protein